MLTSSADESLVNMEAAILWRYGADVNSSIPVSKLTLKCKENYIKCMVQTLKSGAIFNKYEIHNVEICLTQLYSTSILTPGS